MLQVGTTGIEEEDEEEEEGGGGERLPSASWPTHCSYIFNAVYS
jgi:hypothetical protein